MLDCLQVEVSSRCPGRCVYCPHTILQGQWRSQDMDPAVFRRLWPMMRRAARVHLQGWGEPLLHPAFFEMAALARKAGCQVSTTTCGLPMDEALAERIVASGMDIVAFSLAGTDAASNAARQGVGFDRLCQALATLQAVRRRRQGVHLEIHFAYLLLASAMEAVGRLPALMQAHGVHAAVVSTLDYLPDTALSVEAIPPHETEKRERALAILVQTAAAAKRLGLTFDFALADPAAGGTRCRENIARSLFVAVDGAVSPCVYVNLPVEGQDPSRRVFGNVSAQDPVAIWQSEAFHRFRAALACGEPEMPCRTCPKRFVRL